MLFLQDMAFVMIAAGATTILFHRLKQPVVLGYILAGLLIGPFTPGNFVHDQETIRTLGELGVVFLMFSLGLEFSLRKLKVVGISAFIAAFLEIVLMAWVGYELGGLFGWQMMDRIFLGAMISISSTTIIVKALGELGKTREHFAQIIFGILILEDILAILMLALLSGLATTGSLQATKIMWTMGSLGAFLVVVLVGGLILVPRILSYVARFRSNEVLLITALGLCFGVSLLAVKLEYSVALGAFLIGAVIAESRQIAKIEMLTEPLRDMFSAIFFVVIGMMIQPRMLIEHCWPILILTVAVIVGKVIASAFGAYVSGNDGKTSLRVGMGLAQIGEFSFIIAALGAERKVTSDFLYPIAVAVSVLTTLATPYLIMSSDNVLGLLDRTAPRALRHRMEAYTKWVGGIVNNQTPNPLLSVLKSLSLQLGINVFITAAIFGVAAYTADREFVKDIIADKHWSDGFFWLGAMVFTLPFYVASFRKLQAIGMLLAQLGINYDSPVKRSDKVQSLVANTFLIAGCVAMGVGTLLLSSAISPNWQLMIAFGLIVGIAGTVLRKPFAKLYVRGQVALADTFSQAPAPRHQPLPELLEEVQLETIEINADSPVVGKRLIDLNLRAISGASVAVIERNGQRMINPPADQAIQPGDKVLLLGEPSQLEAAFTLFGSTPEAHAH